MYGENMYGENLYGENPSYHGKETGRDGKQNNGEVRGHTAQSEAQVNGHEAQSGARIKVHEAQSGGQVSVHMTPEHIRMHREGDSRQTGQMTRQEKPWQGWQQAGQPLQQGMQPRQEMLPHGSQQGERQNVPQVMSQKPAVIVSPRLEGMLADFRFYGFSCILYGILFTVCLYCGFHGISVPVLSAATIGFLLLVFKKQRIERKKSVWFYFAAWELLSVSSCLTGNGIMIFFNTLGIFLLFFSILFSHFCNTAGWGFGNYLCRMLSAPFAAAAYAGYPFRSFGKYFSKKEKGGCPTAKYVWIGLGVSVPVVVILTCLLASADAVFRSLFRGLFQMIRFPSHPFYLVFLLLIGSLGLYSLLAYFADGKMKDGAAEKKRWEPVAGVAFLSMITVMYLIFSVIQISYLFLGSFALPDGYTYASYAREGFFQLLLVCLINLVIILFCVSRFREYAPLKAVLTVFSCCSFIMIASSAMRMILYIRTYQLTFLRLLVLWALALIGVLLTGCVITVYRRSFPLFSYMTAAVTVFYLAFSLARPDYQIANYNLSHYRDTDVAYLTYLSSDAVPALERAGRLEEISPWRAKELLDAYETMEVRDFNLSYYRAGRILETYDFEK